MPHMVLAEGAGGPDRAEQTLVVSARFRMSKAAGVIAATATGGLQHGCHTTVGGRSEG